MTDEELEKFIKFFMNQDYTDRYDVKKVLQQIYDFGYEDGYNDRFVDYATLNWVTGQYDET